MIYLDANFFIFAILDQTEKGDKARLILKEIVNGKKAVTSVLTLDEVMWVFVKNKEKLRLSGLIHDIYKIPNLTICSVLTNIPLVSLSYLDFLNPRDAFHVACMNELGVTEIVTDDSDFDKVKTIKRIKI